MVAYKLFYFYHLTRGQQAIYTKLKEHIQALHAPPYRVDSNLSEEEAAEAYMALYLDDCSLVQMLPPHLLTFISYSGEIIVAFHPRARTLGAKRERERCEMVATQLIRECEDDANDPQHRYFLSAVTRWLHDHCVYRMTDNGVGESPCDVLLFHTGYCTGFSRTVKYLCEKKGIPVVCVRGKLRRYLSAFIRDEDEAHMLNAIFDEHRQSWIFFDPTSVIGIASKRVRAELGAGYYRENYVNDHYSPLMFFDINTVEKFYILEKKEAFR